MTVLEFGDLDIRVVHERRCRTRWDRVARRRADDHIHGWLYRQGTFVPDYCADPPRHRYLQEVA